MTTDWRPLLPRLAAASAALLLLLTATCRRNDPGAPGDGSSGTPPAPPETGPALTLLGVAAGPITDSGQNGIATLLTVSGRHYLVDSGVGTTRQLAALGLTPSDITAILLTHLHDDHTADLPAWLSFNYTGTIGRLGRPAERRVLVVGPPGTEAYADAADRLLNVSGAIRRAEAGASAGSPRDAFEARAVSPGLVYEDAHLRVTAVENTHYSGRGVQRPAGSLSYAYRIEAGGRVFAFTGDTGPSEAVAQLARGAEVLVAELVTDDPTLLPPGISVEDAQRGHLSPLQAGQLAAAAGVSMLVLSHYNQVTDADLRTMSTVYPGKIVVGRDLMKF